MELTDLLARELPPRRWLLSGFLQERDAALVHCWRGTGSSWFLHGIALAVASGGTFLRYTAPEPRGVLLVDGELPAELLQEMFAAQLKGIEKQPVAPLRILARDMVDYLPSLASAEGQRAIEANLEDVSLVIVDNLSSLYTGSGEENDASSVDALVAWILSLRRRGVSVLLRHHDSKSGKQRGTSRREDVLGQVFQLIRPDDYDMNEGARFEVHVEKARHLLGDAVEPFEAQLVEFNGIATWTWKRVESSARILALHHDGLTQRAIAAQLGIGLGTVNRHLQAAQGRGKGGKKRT